MLSLCVQKRPGIENGPFWAKDVCPHVLLLTWKERERKSARGGERERETGIKTHTILCREQCIRRRLDDHGIFAFFFIYYYYFRTVCSVHRVCVCVCLLHIYWRVCAMGIYNHSFGTGDCGRSETTPTLTRHPENSERSADTHSGTIWLAELQFNAHNSNNNNVWKFLNRGRGENEREPFTRKKKNKRTKKKKVFGEIRPTSKILKNLRQTSTCRRVGRRIRRKRDWMPIAANGRGGPPSEKRTFPSRTYAHTHTAWQGWPTSLFAIRTRTENDLNRFRNGKNDRGLE